jgi:hypothetical protein
MEVKSQVSSILTGLIVSILISSCVITNQVAEQNYLTEAPLYTISPTSTLSSDINVTPTTDPITFLEQDPRLNLIEKWFSGAFQIQWLSDNSFQYDYQERFKFDTVFIDNCYDQLYQEVTISENQSEVTVTSDKSSSKKICNQSWPASPDGQAIIFPPAYSPSNDLAVFTTSTLDPSASLRLDKDFIAEGVHLYQTWIYSTTTRQAIPFVATPLAYNLDWVPDEKSIILSGMCYGDGLLGNGIHVVDRSTLQVVDLTDTWANCEGTVFYKISPDSRFILYDGQLQSLKGGPTTLVCPENMKLYSHTWSEDGQYGYVYCRDPVQDESVLRRIKVDNFMVEDLLGENDIAIKAIGLSVSPNHQWLVFEWGDDFYGNSESYGLWLIKIPKPHE